MNAAAAPDANRIRLIDGPDGPDRTTATLLASLEARLMTLHLVSGADAVGSLVAGFGALGREVSRTAEGARLRQAIETGRPGVNGDTLWTKLRIADWASSMPPSPILDQLRNDLALLLADDLDATLDLRPLLNQMTGVNNVQPIETVTFIDCVLGLWAFSTELTRIVEALAALTASNEVVTTPLSSAEPENTLLR